MQHPKFEEIVKNYVIVNHPEWINKPVSSTTYLPRNDQSQKESFGNNNSKQVCDSIKNYIIFFAFSLIVYLFLEKILKK